jgi:glycosyltransferase involved in cell wall biosynthesis
MNIAMLGYAHPFGEGQYYGAERHLWYLMEEFKKMDQKVVAFTIDGCNLPGIDDYVVMPKPWDDNKDLYLEAIKAYEVSRSIKFDFVYSAMASGYIDHELRTNWPYAVFPYMIFFRFMENVIMYSRNLQARCKRGTVIYFGVPEEAYPEWKEDHKGYLVWLGRMDHGKAPDIAIEVAKRAGKKLVIMGPSYHYPWCHDTIFPHIDDDQVVWLRCCNDRMKSEVLLNAEAILVPLWQQYAEMFGIVNIEALAHGLPVIGWNCSSNPSAMGFNGGEIIEDGKHGFIINYADYSDESRENSIQRGVDAVKQIGNISRGECRSLYESRFTSRIMAEKTLKYMNIIRERGQVHDVTGEL